MSTSSELIPTRTRIVKDVSDGSSDRTIYKIITKQFNRSDSESISKYPDIEIIRRDENAVDKSIPHDIPADIELIPMSSEHAFGKRSKRSFSPDNTITKLSRLNDYNILVAKSLSSTTEIVKSSTSSTSNQSPKISNTITMSYNTKLNPPVSSSSSSSSTSSSSNATNCSSESSISIHPRTISQDRVLQLPIKCTEGSGSDDINNVKHTISISTIKSPLTTDSIAMSSSSMLTHHTESNDESFVDGIHTADIDDIICIEQSPPPIEQKSDSICEYELVRNEVAIGMNELPIGINNNSDKLDNDLIDESNMTSDYGINNDENSDSCAINEQIFETNTIEEDRGSSSSTHASCNLDNIFKIQNFEGVLQLQPSSIIMDSDVASHSHLALQMQKHLQAQQEHQLNFDASQKIDEDGSNLMIGSSMTICDESSNSGDTAVEELEPTIQNLELDQKFNDAESYLIESGEISGDSGGKFYIWVSDT